MAEPAFHVRCPVARVLNHFAIWPFMYSAEARSHSSKASKWKERVESIYYFFLPLKKRHDAFDEDRDQPG